MEVDILCGLGDRCDNQIELQSPMAMYYVRTRVALNIQPVVLAHSEAALR
jgi:hypothetical protein